MTLLISQFNSSPMIRRVIRLILILTILCSSPVYAAQIRVAVASNFTTAAKSLKLEFEKQSEHTVSLSFASTGKLYAQIKNGAPFDIFLAADTERPELLEREGFVAADNRFTYALGQLVLWSSSLEDLDADTLSKIEFNNLAIANPKLAPYGLAAEQVLENLKLREQLQEQLVFAENVAQAFAFVYTGNADLGFIAQSQLQGEAFSSLDGNVEDEEALSEDEKALSEEIKEALSEDDSTSNQADITSGGSFWKVPESYYEPIEQQAILLSKRSAAAEFLLFLMNDKARTIIADAGFKLP